MANLRSFYPEIEPYKTGMLDVGDGHSIYYECSGKAGGKPAVFLHGGPGGGCNSDHRRLFNPDVYDIVLFDQRGCGRSIPYANLESNTTWHLVADIEKLREYFGVEKWLVLGGSWGSTLGIAYAQTYPSRVSELILRGVYTLTKAELDWYYKFGVSEMFPEKWEAFQAPIAPAKRVDMISAYREILIGDNDGQKVAAAKAWSVWEGQTITLLPDASLSDTHSDEQFAVAFARIENHFFYHKAWLEENQLLRDAAKLNGIPGAIVHGRYDMPCPLRYAYELSKTWTNAELHIVEGAGHAFSEPGILHQLISATDRFSI